MPVAYRGFMYVVVTPDLSAEFKLASSAFMVRNWWLTNDVEAVVAAPRWEEPVEPAAGDNYDDLTYVALRAICVRRGVVLEGGMRVRGRKREVLKKGEMIAELRRLDDLTVMPLEAFTHLPPRKPDGDHATIAGRDPANMLLP